MYVRMYMYVYIYIYIYTHRSIQPVVRSRTHFSRWRLASREETPPLCRQDKEKGRNATRVDWAELGWAGLGLVRAYEKRTVNNFSAVTGHKRAAANDRG